MENFTVGKEARWLSKELLAQAEENEPNITSDLQTIALEVSAQIVGLENKFKSEESLTRKLVDAANASSQTLREKAETINDALRYTIVLPFEIYAEGFQETIKRLHKIAYQIPQNRIWNAWQTAGMRFDKGYRGINITVNSSRRQKFELQFHTEASFRLKAETHYLYQELRNREISRQRESELIGELKKAAKNLERPKGV